MRSPFVPDYRTRAGASRATQLQPENLSSGRAGCIGRGQRIELLLTPLPTFLLAKFCDMRGVMFPVPLVKEQQPVDGPFAVFWVKENPGEVFRLQLAPQPVPPR